MKIQVNMDAEQKFSVDSWFAKSPAFVIEALTKQLAAAAAVWPELRDVHLMADSPGDKFMRAMEEAK